MGDLDDLFHYDNTLNDIAEITGHSPTEVLELGDTALVTLATRWKSGPPQTWEELLTYYQKSDEYVYDLAKWHHNEPNRRKIIAQILEGARFFGLQKILDFGAGICTDSMVLSQAGFDVSATDLDCGAFKTGMARVIKHNLPIRFFLQPQVLSNNYDLILAIDVLEHLGPVWPKVLKNLASHSMMLALNTPFQNPVAPNEYQPQHFEEGDIKLEEYLRSWGWVKLGYGWSLFWCHQDNLPERMKVYKIQDD